jgi:hypothetical protein
VYQNDDNVTAIGEDNVLGAEDNTYAGIPRDGAARVVEPIEPVSSRYNTARFSTPLIVMPKHPYVRHALLRAKWGLDVQVESRTIW